MDIQPSRFETGKPLLIAGLREHHAGNPSQTIPPQWAKFKSYLGKIPGQIGQMSYGVSTHCTEAGHFDYLCGVEVNDASAIAAPFFTIEIPEQYYAVFQHREHISTIKDTYVAIWEKWLPTSGYQIAEDAPLFERYDQRFDPQTETGIVEIWIPLKS
jgi:AraC family transcriptional regulator